MLGVKRWKQSTKVSYGKQLGFVLMLVTSLSFLLIDSLNAQILTVNKSGSGGGTVTSSPPGINCGSDCTETFDQGSKIKLKAKADPGSAFVGWSGACTGTAKSCTLTLEGNQVVIATFVLPDLWGEWSDISVEGDDSGYDVSGTLTVYSDQGKASSVTARIYLSNNGNYDGTDTLLGSIKFGSINAGASKAKTVRYTLTTAPSGKYLIALIDPDDTVQESDEGDNEEGVNLPSEGGAMEVTSAAFKDQGKIPMKYVMPGAGGQNVSIPIHWENVPPGTKSFALSMVDIHPVAQNWVHWLVINIPKEATSIAEGASGKSMPSGAVELQNSFGFIGYGGPEPPIGTGDHPYVVTIYALNVETLALGVSTSLFAFNNAIQGKVIESATITGMYGR